MVCFSWQKVLVKDKISFLKNLCSSQHVVLLFYIIEIIIPAQWEVSLNRRKSMESIKGVTSFAGDAALPNILHKATVCKYEPGESDPWTRCRPLPYEYRSERYFFVHPCNGIGSNQALSGDSGGPLLFYNSGKREYIQIGVISANDVLWVNTILIWGIIMLPCQNYLPKIIIKKREESKE